MKQPVSLQINLSPGDYPHVRYILPHQLNTLAGQVNEIILTVETRPSKGRFAIGWAENQTHLDDFLQNVIKPCYEVKIIPVDYSASTKAEVADCFFGARHIPNKDFRGGPFYAYFFGLYSATNSLVFHLDSDMFLGGGSQTWVKEAVELFRSNPRNLIISPLPGPPHPEDKLIGQRIIDKISPYTYLLKGMSTRIFLVDKTSFQKAKLRYTRPALPNQIKAVLQGNPNIDLPEHIISAYLEKNIYNRIDFLGTTPGMWSLHPPYRTKSFYENLPAIIARVEAGDMPAEQKGFYDLTDELCDWSEAREKLKTNRWWKRIFN